MDGYSLPHFDNVLREASSVKMHCFISVTHPLTVCVCDLRRRSADASHFTTHLLIKKCKTQSKAWGRYPTERRYSPPNYNRAPLSMHYCGAKTLASGNMNCSYRHSRKLNHVRNYTLSLQTGYELICTRLLQALRIIQNTNCFFCFFLNWEFMHRQKQMIIMELG